MTGVRRNKPAIALVCTIVVLGAWMGTSAVASAGEVLEGVAVAGVPVSGLQPTQLMTRLAPAARAFERRPLTLTVGERTWLKTPEAMGITVDLKRSSVNALGAGRSNSFTWMLNSLSSKERKLAWVPKVDEAKLKASVEELTKLVNVEASNGDFTVTGSRVKVTPPTEGITLLASATRATLVRAALNPEPADKVNLPVKKTAPQIKLGQLEQVKQQAEGILQGPVEFTLGDKTISVPPEKIAPALKVKETKSGSVKSLELSADSAILKNQIVAFSPGVNVQPKDATFSLAGEKVVVQPSVDGTSIDTVQAAVALVGLATGERRSIPLPVTVQKAELSTDAASKLGINGRIASFTTTFDARNAPRVGNIDRMAQAMDGKLIKPGDTFSLNAATGNRTVANGYQEAGILVDGEVVPGIGGGVCQVATTLFNAVFNAGLEVVERSNHSLFISKYPLGKDAMVNFGVQDLEFRNDSRYGLLLKARVSAKELTVSIYSSPLGRVVTETVSPQTNPRVPPVKFVDDPLLPKGTETITEPGIPGFDITVTRKVTEEGKVIHSDSFVSKYKPWKKIVKKGTGPAAPVAPLVPAPAASSTTDPGAPPNLPPPPATTGG